MKKYICVVCGHIYDEEKEKIKFKDLEANWICPICHETKYNYFLYDIIPSKDEVPNDIILCNAIEIAKDNIAIMRDKSKCIDCGLCKLTCINREGIKNINHGKACVNCGQCIQACPVGALWPKSSLDIMKLALKNKVCIVYTSPAVRVSLGDAFGLAKGEMVEGKMVAALRKLGFQYVLDTTFGADLTVMEEASELIERLKSKKNLPMFTSCCPSWVKYCEINYPELLPNLSTCKSPISMQGAIVKEYFIKEKNLKPEDVFTVALTPCTSKKYEVKRPELIGTDLVLTTIELCDLIKENNIDFKNLNDSNYDELIGSGAGLIFGNTGGVMEATLRTSYKLLTNEDLPNLNFKPVRGLSNVKEAILKIGDTEVKVAVINQMASAIPILEQVKNHTCPYDFIEIMNCFGGCIGGGGQIKCSDELNTKEKRLNSLYNKDANSIIRYSYQNPKIQELYTKYLDHPLSTKAENLLHTQYENKSNLKEEK